MRKLMDLIGIWILGNSEDLTELQRYINLTTILEIRTVIFMSSELDLISREDRLISIMDMTNDVNISNEKWNFIFEYFIEKTEHFYFSGWHLDASFEDEIKENLTSNVKYSSEQIYMDFELHHRLFFKIKSSHVSINRSLLSRIWQCYDYPSIIFSKYKNNEKKLIESYLKNNFIESPHFLLDGIFIMQKKTESNVIWLQKSKDMLFPWNTMRSPMVISKEKNKSLYRRIFG